jgi:alkylation response protein AidB-like acyl-CoA dehydrogenase
MTTTRTDVADELRRSAGDVLGADGAAERAERAAATERGYDDELWRTMASLGWPGIAAGEDVGGSGATSAEVAVVVAELGRHLVGSPLVPSLLAVGALERAGDGGARTRFAPALVSGERTGTILVTAADGRPGGERLATRSSPRAGGGVRLDGRTAYVPGGSADVLIVAAQRDDGAIDVAAVDAARCAASVTVRRMQLFDATRAFHEVELHGVDVDADDLLAPPGTGGALVHEMERAAATMVALDCVGGAARALEITVDYVTHRRQFDQPIGAFQVVQHRCADMLLRCEAARVLTEQAAARMWQPDEEGPDVVSMAKADAGDAYAEVSGAAMQLHGAIGYTWEYGLHHHFRRAKLDQALLGSSAYHRQRVAAGMIEQFAPGPTLASRS